MRYIKEYNPDTFEVHDPRDVGRNTAMRGEKIQGNELKDGCSKRKPSKNYHQIERDKTGGRGSLGGDGTEPGGGA